MGRFFLLRPDPDSTIARIVIYCLALAAAQFGLLVHAVCVMSTHYHVVVTDVRGVLPRFLHRFNRLLALAVQCHRGWGEEVFNKSQTSRVELCSVEAILDRMAYVLANPVAAGAVYTGDDWPGLRTRARDIGNRTLRADKPAVYFHAPCWAASASVKVTWPAQVLEVMSAEEARSCLIALVEEHEKKPRTERKKRGEKILGARRCTRVPIDTRATAYEVWGALNPTFATGRDRALYDEMVMRRRAFRADHRASFERWQAGDHSVLFPAYTWKMRHIHGAGVRPP